MSRTIACLTICLLTFISAACERVPLLAPTGSAVTLSINTTNVPINGTAQLTAVVIEAGGTAPQNGTQVTFLTTLGTIEPADALTQNGRATATFRAGNRIGTAQIRALSGDAETEAAEITVGAGEGTIALRIESRSGNATVIVATVLDSEGNTVPGAPVTFSADAGTLSVGTTTANSVGEARTTLIASEEAVVRARSGAAEDTITINAPAQFTLEVTTPAPPAQPEAGLPVTFTIAPTGTAFFSDVVVNFGDGTAEQNLGSVSSERTFQHTFATRGTYTVTARANGGSATSTVIVAVTDPSPLVFSTMVSANTVSLASNSVVTFTVTPTTIGTTAPVIAKIDWNFGDGHGSTTTSTTTSWRYTATGTYAYEIVVTAVDGRRGRATGTIRVTP